VVRAPGAVGGAGGTVDRHQNTRGTYLPAPAQ